MKPKISFKEYYTSLNQETFKNKEYTDKPKYIKKVIKKLNGIKSEDDKSEGNKSDIRLGKNGDEGRIEFNKNNKIYKSIIDQLADVSKNGDIVNITDITNIDTFNKLLSLAIINNGNVNLLSSKIPGNVVNYWEVILMSNDDDTNNSSSADSKKSSKATIGKPKNNKNIKTDLKGTEEIKLDVNVVKEVINKLIKGVKTNLKGVEEIKLEKTDDIDKIIIEILNATSNKLTLVMFNELLNVKYKTKNVWSKIFKGDFSKYPNGLASNNKGNAFENELAKLLNNKENKEKIVYDTIVKIFNISGIKNVREDGGKNNSRPLKFVGDQLLVDGKIENNGAKISDVTVIDNEGKEHYISAKYGNTVSFGSSGVTKFFPKKWFTGEDKNLPNNGIALLKMFGINQEKFKSVFVDYVERLKDESPKANKKDAIKIVETPKNWTDNEEKIINLLKSYIGSGYLLIHKIKDLDITNDKNANNLEYFDLREGENSNSLLEGGITGYKVEYPDNSNKLVAKRVNVIIEFKHIIFKINFRDKSGVGTYPTYMNADYVFKK